jgi:hypothetical protein
MRVIFAFIGLIFDLVILALAGAVIYCMFDLRFLYDQFEIVKPYLEDQQMRLQVGAIAGVFFVMAFRGIFLLMFGSRDKVFTVKRTEQGALTVSKATLEHVVSRIAADQALAASVATIKIFQDGSALSMRLKIRLDLTKCNLTEYIDKFSAAIRGYFKDSLSIELSRLDIQAEAAISENEAA